MFRHRACDNISSDMGEQRPEQRRILEGIRVVEVATHIFGPAAAAVMSDFGADVIKIERPDGDSHRRLSSIPPLPVAEMNYTWLLDNRNKRSIVLNLSE